MKHLTDAITRWTGATRSEALIAMIICLTLLTGWAVREVVLLLAPDPHATPRAAAMQHLIDSLDDVMASSRIGTDRDGVPYAPLAAADTQIRQPQRFPGSVRRDPPTSGVNINTASLAQLMRLPGVGEATARRILEHRTVSPFTLPEDIMRVKGIGPKKFAKMKAFIRVST